MSLKKGKILLHKVISPAQAVRAPHLLVRVFQPPGLFLCSQLGAERLHARACLFQQKIYIFYIAYYKITKNKRKIMFKA